MNDQFPLEAEGCERLSGESPEIAGVEGVNDASAKLNERYEWGWFEIPVLARHYLWKVRELEHELLACGGPDCSWLRAKADVERSLDKIRQFMSEDGFTKAVAPVEEKWNRKFHDLRVYLVTQRGCEECGRGFYPRGLGQVECNECGKRTSHGLEGEPY